MTMKKILHNLFFGKAVEGEKPSHSYKTIYPPAMPSFQKWASEYNVGMLWDRKKVYIH